jgi:hyperosmotically inducible protein
MTRWVLWTVLLVSGQGLAWGAGTGAPTDKERAQSIQVQLRNDPDLVDDAITVQVTGKTVRLSGAVDSEDERQRAEDVVHRTEPEATVDNRLTAPKGTSTRSTADRSADKVRDEGKKVAHKAAKAATDVGEMATDAWITSKIKATLMGTDGVHASGITVETSDGVVTLRGNVRSDDERNKAVSIARGTRGAVKVVDALSVVPH